METTHYDTWLRPTAKYHNDRCNNKVKSDSFTVQKD